jgi:hypothetical protein
MTFREVMLSIDGLNNGKRFNRLCVLAICASGMNGKVVKQIEKIIPIDGDGQGRNVSERVKQTLRHFQELDAKKKIQDGRRS